MRKILIVALALLALGLSQAAADPRLEKTDQTPCRIEDWRWSHSAVVKALTIEGAASCTSGHVIMRVYSRTDEGDVYLGNANAFIDGYAFTAIVTSVEEKPESLSVRYTISGE